MSGLRRTRELAASTALALAATAAALGVAEIALRQGGLAAGEAESRAAAFRPAARAEDALTREVLHPFLGWSARGDASALRHAPGDFAVAVLGGSVAGTLVQTARDELTRRLGELRPGLGRVRWIQLGRGGYKQPQQAIFLLELLLLGTPIDLVLNLDGYNDIALGAENAQSGVHPLFPSQAHYAGILDAVQGLRDPDSIRLVARGIELRARAERVETWLRAKRGLARSHLVMLLAGRFAARWENQARALESGWTGRAAGGIRQRIAALPEACLGRAQGCLELQASIWQRSSLAMHLLATGFGIPYLHLLQPNQYVRGAKPLSPEELASAYRPEYPKNAAVEPGYRLLRAKGAELGARGVAFRDLSMLFAGVRETLYVDDCCHVNRRGNALLAAAVAEQVAEQIPARP